MKKNVKKLTALVISGVMALGSAFIAYGAGTVLPKALPGPEGVPGEFDGEIGRFDLNGTTYVNFEGGAAKFKTGDEGAERMIYGGGRFADDGTLKIDDSAVNHLADRISGQEITDSAHRVIGDKATDEQVHQLFHDAFVKLAKDGHMPGVTVSPIDEWNGQVKLDLRFSDSTAIPFNWQRPFMTTLFLSSDGKAVYPVRDWSLMTYKDNMGDLGSPKGYVKEVVVDGKTVLGQEFDNGTIIFDADANYCYGKAGDNPDEWGEHSIPYGLAKVGQFFESPSAPAAETPASTGDAPKANASTGDLSANVWLFAVIALAAAAVFAFGFKRSKQN